MTVRRRGLAALLALVLLVPGTVAVTAGLEIADRARTAPDPVRVAAGHAITVGGMRWEVRGSQEFDADSNPDIPGGSALVGALVDVAPVAGAHVAEGASCSVSLQADHAGVTRQWTLEGDPERYGWVPIASTFKGCTATATTPTVLELVFLTPAGTIDGAGIVVTVSDGKGAPVRFRLALHA